MTDPAERFIEAAVRPLADNAEMQILAEHELRTAIGEAAGCAESDSLDQAAENLEKGGLPRWFKAALYGLTALAVILAAIPLARDYQRYRLATFRLFGMGDPDMVPLPGLPLKHHSESQVAKLLGDFSPAEKLLLFGKQADYPETFRALWKSDPQSAAYFAEHARACGSHGTPRLPTNFLETADRLDVGNGWFRCYAAGFAAREAVQENPDRRRGTPTAPRPRYVVKDPAKLAEAISLLDEAARMPRFESYESGLFLRRIEILPPGADTLDRLFVVKYLEMDPQRSRWIHRYIAQAVTVKCQELALAGDSPGFLKVTASWETFVRRSIEYPSLPPNAALWALSGFTHAARELTAAALTLGLKEKAGRYQRLVAELELRKAATNRRFGEARELLMRGGPDAERLTLPTARSENPPPLADDDLRPGYMADLAKRERLNSAAMGGMILAGALLITVTGFLRGPQVRRLSASLFRVLRPEDHAWILAGGILLPVLVHVLTEPLEAKPPRYFIQGVFLTRMALQAAVLMAIPSILAARRLHRRLGCAGWNHRSIPEPIAIGLGLILIVIARFAAPQTHSIALWLGALLCLLPFALGYLVSPISAIFSAHKSAMFWVTHCRTLLPAHLLAVLLMALLVPLHHAREKQSTELNVLTKIEPGIPAMNRYEHEIENQVRKDLLELLDAKP